MIESQSGTHKGGPRTSRESDLFAGRTSMPANVGYGVLRRSDLTVYVEVGPDGVRW